jgi:hypothetical protein
MSNLLKSICELRTSVGIVEKKGVTKMSTMDKVKILMQKLKEGSFDVWHEDDSRELLECIPDLEEKQKIKYPKNYLDYVKDINVSFLKNDHFNMDFFGCDGLSAHNIGKKKKLFLKDFIVFALGARSTLFFIDAKNSLGKGIDAIFRIDWNSKYIGKSKFLAKDFEDLFKIFITNKKPNDKPLK